MASPNTMNTTTTTFTIDPKVLTMVTKYRDNADESLRIHVDVNSADKDEQLRTVATALCPFLYNDENTAMNNHTDLVVKPLGGGLSNELFIVSSSSDSVLVRIHPGDGTEKLADQTTSSSSGEVVDRNVENRLAAWLSLQGMAPIYYGRFENGRVEEFYKNVVTLSCHEMASFAPQIATAMAKFHQLDAPMSILPKPTTRHDATVYETIDRWLDSLLPAQEQLPEAENNSDFLKMLNAEWKWLSEELQATPTTTTTPIEEEALAFIRQVVVTHMDCQSLNILTDKSAGNHSDIRLIDFEYAGWNPRAADIANTFCEHCDMNNIQADYETEYPTEAQQDTYFRAYMQQANPSLWERLSQDSHDEQLFLATLRSEVGRFTLLSHLGWSVWSVLKTKETESNIDFDYMKYARHRMDGYKLFRGKFY